ncbi:hypothetical protein AMTR_s00062p00167890 [Amborella trichopoda]|uniref:Uncharacterized protein n=1 Tax=Amborella trichopoda TaxID=13333 RepID=U5DBS9_AMBTC|nr:hypothetical protein AMTR_s00062p00167890 [Amborella trichopoda]
MALALLKGLNCWIIPEAPHWWLKETARHHKIIHMPMETGSMLPSGNPSLPTYCQPFTPSARSPHPFFLASCKHSSQLHFCSQDPQSPNCPLSRMRLILPNFSGNPSSPHSAHLLNQAPEAIATFPHLLSANLPISRHSSFNIISIRGQPKSCFSGRLESSLIGQFHPHRDDLRGIENWARNYWQEPNFLCYTMAGGGTLFISPSASSAHRGLQGSKPSFKGDRRGTWLLHIDPLEIIGVFSVGSIPDSYRVHRTSLHPLHALAGSQRTLLLSAHHLVRCHSPAHSQPCSGPSSRLHTIQGHHKAPAVDQDGWTTVVRKKGNHNCYHLNRRDYRLHHRPERVIHRDGPSNLGPHPPHPVSDRRSSPSLLIPNVQSLPSVPPTLLPPHFLSPTLLLMIDTSTPFTCLLDTSAPLLDVSPRMPRAFDYPLNPSPASESSCPITDEQDLNAPLDPIDGSHDILPSTSSHAMSVESSPLSLFSSIAQSSCPPVGNPSHLPEITLSDVHLTNKFSLSLISVFQSPSHTSELILPASRAASDHSNLQSTYSTSHPWQKVQLSLPLCLRTSLVDLQLRRLNPDHSTLISFPYYPSTSPWNRFCRRKTSPLLPSPSSPPSRTPNLPAPSFDLVTSMGPQISHP